MNNMVTILTMVLIGLIFLVMTLIGAFIIIKIKEKQGNVEEKINIKSVTDDKNVNKTKIAKDYDTKSVFDFMEFENVKDNMIVQKRW